LARVASTLQSDLDGAPHAPPLPCAPNSSILAWASERQRALSVVPRSNRETIC
jgi:hypothetical protein